MIISFLSTHFISTQIDFINGRSSLQQLLLVMNSIIEAKENCTGIDIIYLDIWKAIDTVPHNELLHKLWSLRIHGRLWLLLRAYLLGRPQSVRINQAILWLLTVISGVPQGGILGPQIFTIYINNFPEMLKQLCHCISFCRWHKMYFPLHTPSDQIAFQEDLNNVCIWPKKWKLSFNCTKCAMLHFWQEGTEQVTYVYTKWLHNRVQVLY